MESSRTNGIRITHLILLITFLATVCNISFIPKPCSLLDLDHPGPFSLTTEMESERPTRIAIPSATTTTEIPATRVPPLLRTNHRKETPNKSPQCRFYLAESALPKAGLGVFTTIPIPQNAQTHPMPDICILIAASPQNSPQIDSHAWQPWRFLGNFERPNPRAMCEGVSTLFNSVARVHTSTPETVTGFIHSNGGLERGRSAGAGAITHYFGITSKAVRNIAAGSEITIAGGDGSEGPPSQDTIQQLAPNRSTPWLQTHGMCMDNIRIQPATNPTMGRGAFAAYTLDEESIVAPAPLQAFRRSIFLKEAPQELIFNYCFQPKGLDVLLFPYGAGVGLINHSSTHTNVGLRWSTSNMNHPQWLDLPLDEFWKITYQGGLILEVYALRDITPGEELFLDYGTEWETAWDKHERNWSAIEHAEDYTYPADMDLTLPFRTKKEQKSNPNPSNLMTTCDTASHNIREFTIKKWKAPQEPGYQHVQACDIMERKKTKTGGFEYKISLHFERNGRSDASHGHIDTHVPHSAIGWVDIPFMNDMYLENAFRHPIGLPDNLVPSQWMDL